MFNSINSYQPSELDSLNQQINSILSELERFSSVLRGLRDVEARIYSVSNPPTSMVESLELLTNRRNVLIKEAQEKQNA